MTREERYASMSNSRFEDETYEEYRERLKITKTALKAYLKGVGRKIK
jgi:hypothetical protein